MPSSVSDIALCCEEVEAGIEIESKIVSNLAEKHNLFISGCWYLFHGIVQNNSVLVRKVEYFLYQFIAFVYELYIMFVYYLLYSFLHAERN